MKCLLIYDIPNDRVRTKIADFCLDYGLDRIQLSSFTGDLSRTHQEELLLKIKARIGKHTANVQLIPICRDDWEKRLVLIQEEEEET